MVSCENVALRIQLLRALAAEAQHLYAVAFDAESARSALFEMNGTDIVSGHVHDSLTTKANQVVMRHRVGFKSSRSVMRADLMNQPVLLKRFQMRAAAAA